MSYTNPYAGNSIWEFFLTLIVRLFSLVTGEISISNLATDEVQLLVLIGVAASSALVGTFLILKKMTMLANSLSHTILLGIVGVYFFSQMQLVDSHNSFALDIPNMIFASVCMGIITTFLTEFLTKKIKVQEDASTGIVFTTLFALGIILVTVLTKNAHIGTEVVMGNVDALLLKDNVLIYVILLINIVVIFLFFKEFKITTFDSTYANTLGISSLFFNYLLMIQVSLTIIGAFRAVGVLMVLSFLTGPPLTARLLTHSFMKMIGYSILIGVIASLLGVALSRHILSIYGVALSTGGLVVCVITVLFILVLISKLIRQKNLKPNFVKG